MNDNLISIVIPCFNSASYIKNFIDKILSLKNNIEILLIDDGSVDNTYEVISNINDSRIRSFHQDNYGVSSARNLGIKEAKGEYICFFDADDDIDLSLFEECMVIDDNDITMFGMYFDHYLNDKLLRTDVFTTSDYQITKSSDKLGKFKELYKNNYMSSVWNKIFSLKLIRDNNIYFNEELRNYEDLAFSTECFLNSDRILVLGKAYYHYNIHKNIDSASSGYNSEFSNGMLKTINYLIKIYSKYNIDRNWYINSLITMVTQGVCNICKSNDGFTSEKSKLSTFLSNENINLILNNATSYPNTFAKIFSIFARSKNYFLLLLLCKFRNLLR